MIKNSRKKTPQKRLFVLDTNVLIHDPTALYRFEEHDIYLPMVVLEELDNAKKGTSEVACNVREVSRYIGELLIDVSQEKIIQGIPIPEKKSEMAKTITPGGKLFFQTKEISTHLPITIPGNKADNALLALTLDLQVEHPDTVVILVSKDMNLRIKAGILGILNEDYTNDRVLEDIRLLHTGIHELPKDFWETHGKQLDSWKESGRTFYKVSGPMAQGWFPNDCIYLSEGEPFDAIVRRIEGNEAIIEYVKDYTQAKHAVWGISARNREQNFAMNLLMDPQVDIVTLQGQAGTGKTLLSLAAGLAQTLDQKRFREIIMTRVTVPLGEDIGFLPGTEEEKMTPWMGALMDNLEVLMNSDDHSDWGRAATQDLLMNYIKIRSLNFMRGRTFLNKFIIIDEAQNLTPKQMKTLITRSGPGTKMVCLGDIAQIDTPYLTETTSGLTYAVDRFKVWSHSGHITMKRGERSRLADFAASAL